MQEEKRCSSTSPGGEDPEPPLVAAAIAAFTANNDRNRVHALGLGLPALPSKPSEPSTQQRIAGITLTGTAPVFYKINVTAELVAAVGSGSAYPESSENPTIVYAHLPVVPRPNRRWSEGMKLLDNRRVILDCYEAFKRFVN